MAVQTEAVHTGEFILSEANGSLSREEVTITGGSFVAGQVLGKVTASGKYTDHDPAAVDGSENAVAILYDAVDASSADQDGVVIIRNAEVNNLLLTWKTGIAANDKAAGVTNLALTNVIVR